MEPLFETQSLEGSQDPQLRMLHEDRELREIIRQDIDRTVQEIDFFVRPDVKEKLSNILYLWARDNNEYGYRHGMNEVLAIIVQAIFQETINQSDPALDDLTKDSDLEDLTDDQLLQIIFSDKYAYADTYWCFDSMMGLGVKYLYEVTKDM